MADKPYYPYKPIGSISVLAKMLEVNESLLKKIASNASASYTVFEINPPEKKSRDVAEPKESLKYIQRKINSMIFSEVIYPNYLMGGIKDKINTRDYIANGELHLDKKTLINLDIENFFPNIKSSYVYNIFRYLFKFPDDVSDILTKLTTLNGAVPQGGCTSTYIANLLFFNNEYSLVSKLRSKGIVYSRLLDDITLSSDKTMDKNETTSYISLIKGMIKKLELKLNNKKTRIEYSDSIFAKYVVTGTCVRFKEIKFPKKERDKIRTAVKQCELMYKTDCYNEEYHKHWNRTSGRINQLKRFGYCKQERDYRKRLKQILPLYNAEQAKTLEVKVFQLINKRKRNKLQMDNPKTKKQVLKTYHQLGILSRNNNSLSSILKYKMRDSFDIFISNPYY